MKPFRIIIRLLVLCIPAVYLYCGGEDPVAGGSDSEDFEGYGFSGTAVYADGAPAARAAVAVHPYDSYGSGGSAPVSTDSAGAFSVTGLQPGIYSITIIDSADNGYAVEKTISATGLTQLAEAVLAPAGTLAGTVTLDAADGGLYPLWVRIRGIWKSASTNSAGAYAITGIPAGIYTVRIESPWPANTAYGIRETTAVIASGAATTLDIDGLPLRSAGGMYTQDSLLVQEILDSNGITAPVANYTHVLDGRVISFHDFGGTITRLPAGIGSLDALEVLILIDGNVVEWPAKLASLHGLKKLSLIKQGLTDLPVPFTSLTELVELKLSGNALGTLPDAVFGFTDLHFLYADSCGLTALQPDIIDLTLLNQLYLRDNALSELPAGLAGMDNLSRIGIAGNNLCTLSDTVRAWLETVDTDWDSAGQCQ